jgi:hypothetical protein
MKELTIEDVCMVSGGAGVSGETIGCAVGGAHCAGRPQLSFRSMLRPHSRCSESRQVIRPERKEPRTGC